MAAASTTPKLSGMKYLVEKVLHSDDHGAILLIGDQGSFGKHYALEKVKREDPEKDDVYIERARASCDACQSQKLTSATFLQYYDFRLTKSFFRTTGAEVLMEYVAGRSLAEAGRLTIPQYALIFQQLATALATMYRRGVFHGDLKLSNVMVSKSGQVKLLNYGVAAVQPNFPKQDVGTRDYMSPEQMNEKVIDEPSEVYAFGALMYHATTGRPANTGTRVIGQGGKIPIPTAINSSIPVGMNNLMVSCLQTSVDRRPPTMYDVNQQLEAIVKNLGIDPEDTEALKSVGTGRKEE